MGSQARLKVPESHGAIDDRVSHAADHGCQRNVVVNKLSPLHQHERVSDVCLLLVPVDHI